MQVMLLEAIGIWICCALLWRAMRKQPKQPKRDVYWIPPINQPIDWSKDRTPIGDGKVVEVYESWKG